MWTVTADLGRFSEALAHFLDRVVLTDVERKSIPKIARTRAFWVAGATQLETVQFVHDELTKSIERGTPFSEFKKAVSEKLTKAWGKENPARVETILRNAAQSSYNSGRWHQMRDPAVLKFRPFWMFDAVLDSRSSPICPPLDNTVLAADDPFWDSHLPPLHHRCFPPGTMVLTDAGNRPIESLRVGDRVLTHRGRYRAVTETMRSVSPDRLVKVTGISGSACIGTAAHPALTQRGWVEFAALRPGDHLLKVGELPRQDRMVRNPNRDQARGRNETNPVQRIPLTHLTEFDRQICGWQEVVHEEHGIRELNSVLEYVRSPGGLQPFAEQTLGLRGHASETASHTVGVFADGYGAGRTRTSDHVRTSQTTTQGQFFGDATEPGMRFLGLALGPVDSGGGSGANHLPKPHGASPMFPVRISGPLIGDGVGPAANRDSVFLQESADGTHVAASEFAHGLPKRQPTRDIEISQDFTEALTVLRKQTALDCVAEVTIRHEWLDSDAAEVFNLAVEEDESYVADGFVVHNCRSGIRSLRKSQAEEIGIADKAPDIDAQDGFGASPSVAAVWKPSPEGKEPALVKSLKAKAKGADFDAPPLKK